jgi:PPOX class probable F420-dependent enzyme
MTTMTQAQIEAFLMAPQHAIVGTNRIDGPPQLSPVWYMYHEGRIYLGVNAGTAKHQNLKRDPRISLCIDGGHGDARAVIIYGTAELIEGRDPLKEEMSWRIIRKYHATEEQARAYADQVRDLPSVLVIVTPQKIISQDFR